MLRTANAIVRSMIDTADAPLILLRGADVASTADVSRQDVLIAGSTIIAVGTDLADLVPSRLVTTRDLDGWTIVPGFVDAHVHFLGGGGGDGFDSRAPELQLTELTIHGITTAVGTPGIDMASRSLEGLLAKAQGLETEGITTFAYAGGFQRPLASITGSPWRDCYLLPRVAGVKIAVGEIRTASHSVREIVDLARELAWVEHATRRGAVLHVHLGRETSGRELLLEVLPQVPDASRIVVTHVNFSAENLAVGPRLAALGARLDVSTALAPDRGTRTAIPAADAIDALLVAGVAPDRLSISSDGNGEVPLRVDGAWEPYRNHVDSFIETVRSVATRRSLPLAVTIASTNPARAIGVGATKGEVVAGRDADLVVLDRALGVAQVYARGRLLVDGGSPTALGRFERRERHA
jgi:beta-aspartyl-dipeptidase (metallo-type)